MKTLTVYYKFTLFLFIIAPSFKFVHSAGAFFILFYYVVFVLHQTYIIRLSTSPPVPGDSVSSVYFQMKDLENKMGE